MRGVADGGGIQIGGEEKILLSHGYDEVFSFFCRHRGHSITMLTKRGGRGSLRSPWESRDMLYV